MKFTEYAVEMKTFSYKAYDDSGSRMEGTVEATDETAAIAKLHSDKLMVAHVEENQAVTQELQLFSRQKVTSQELEYLTSELAILLKAGVTLDRGLEVIKRNASSGPQLRLITTLHDGIRKGDSLWGILASQGNIFNPLYVNLVKLGESSGTLPKVFERLAQDIRFQGELKRKVVQAMTYPTVVLLVCVLSIVFIFNYIVPQMKGLFDGMPEIPVYTSFLLNASDWILQYQWSLFLILLAVFT